MLPQTHHCCLRLAYRFCFVPPLCFTVVAVTQLNCPLFMATAAISVLGLAQAQAARYLPASQQLRHRQFHWGSASQSSSSNPLGGITDVSDTAANNSTGTLADSLPSDSASTGADVLSAAAVVTAPDLGLFTAGAAALDAIHAATGLPWCAVIPAAAVAIKTLLLPISLQQAKIVRTNMVLWREAYEFQKQQQARMDRLQSEQQQQQQQQQQKLHQSAVQQMPLQRPQQHQGTQQQQQQQQQGSAPAAAATGGQGALDAAAAALQQLQHWQQRIELFHDLRRKCGVPHPAWFVVNSSLQVPIFIYTAVSIRRMAQANWPGFSSEGALWFTDLTQPALVLAEAGMQLPLGLPGLILPFAATGIMLTSIHLGFKASGAAAKHPSVSGTWISTMLTYMRPFLYALTLASAAIKVQLPQAPVLHWVTMSSYTLGLQLGLKSPKVRQVLGFSQAGSVDSSKDIDPAVVAQAAAMDNADVLVVMGAKHAALQRYNEAMYCLQRALQLNPDNARAHYSAGQIYALQGLWPQSEHSYKACAALSTDPSSKAQALYCVGVACHQQGNYPAAVDAYDAAVAAGPGDNLRPMLALGTARALKQQGRDVEAAAVAQEMLRSQWAGLCAPPVAQALKDLAAAAAAAAGAHEAAGAGVGAAGLHAQGSADKGQAVADNQSGSS